MNNNNNDHDIHENDLKKFHDFGLELQQEAL